MHVNIISKDNGVGLSREISILYDVLIARGMQVTASRMSIPPEHGRVLRSYLSTLNRIRNHNCRRHHLQRSSRFDLNIFLERIRPEWLPCAHVNCLIPNQECFTKASAQNINFIDLVLCKTLHAQKVFDQLGCATEYISFTSEDRYDPSISKNYNSAFHLAGSSPNKSTEMLIDIWAGHSEWPRLDIIQRTRTTKKIRESNINHIVGYMDDTRLRSLQNTHGLHLCPSQVEGFGHYIVEGMSTQAVTMVTDAPPMNELAAKERSILLEHLSANQSGLGTIFHVDPQSVEEKVNQALAMDSAQKRKMGANAREWFRENDSFFRNRLLEVVTGL